MSLGWDIDTYKIKYCDTLLDDQILITYSTINQTLHIMSTASISVR